MNRPTWDDMLPLRERVQDVAAGLEEVRIISGKPTFQGGAEEPEKDSRYLDTVEVHGSSPCEPTTSPSSQTAYEDAHKPSAASSHTEPQQPRHSCAIPEVPTQAELAGAWDLHVAVVTRQANEIRDLRRQRDELHAANNRLLEERREAEAKTSASDRPGFVLDWAVRTFGDAAAEKHERAMRLFEEATEVLQAAGVESWRADAIVRRVYYRKPGDLTQELGSVIITAECLAAAAGIGIHQAAAAEWARVQSIDPEKMRTKHAEKVAAGIATDVPRG